MKVIISLTSTYERTNLLFYGIQAILKQSVKPDLILLNISEKPYLNDSGFKDIPDWLLGNSIKLNWVENTGSYRKLVPALDFAEDNDIIVTADDDILYDKNWLKNLIEVANSEIDSIVCCRARIMSKNIFGNWQNYSNWDLINESMNGINILPTGGAGAVYRKRLLDTEFLTDKKFMEIAPTTDDLWFRMASMRKNTPVAVFPEIDRQNIYLHHALGLEEENVYKPKHSKVPFFAPICNRWMRLINYMGRNQSKNDFAWDSICKYVQTI